MLNLAIISLFGVLGQNPTIYRFNEKKRKVGLFSQTNLDKGRILFEMNRKLLLI